MSCHGESESEARLAASIARRALFEGAEDSLAMLGGHLIEVDSNDIIFSRRTADERTFRYVEGLFG